MRGQGRDRLHRDAGRRLPVLTSDGGVDAFNAPCYGSLVWPVPTGQSVTGITGE
jgi:hypothetical protein